MNHIVPPGTMAAAMQNAGVKLFDFDLLDALRNVHVHEFGNSLLSRLAFATDAYINIAIQTAMSKLRADVELAGNAPWDTYQAFLGYVSGIAANEQLMTEAGMEITPLRQTVQKLYNLRMAIYDTLGDRLGLKYREEEIPLITEWMRNPRIRRDDPTTIAKRQLTTHMLATDPETGVVDVEMEKQLQASLAIKDGIQKADQLKWDKQRGELASLMFEALKIDEHVDAADPFGDLDVEHQRKLLDGTKRYVSGVLDDLARDRKITFEVHAAAVKESQPLLKAVRLALEHPRFVRKD